MLKSSSLCLYSSNLGTFWLKIEQFWPKFELYAHDELFNIYYGIFYELWTFAYFDRLCKLEKRGDEIKWFLMRRFLCEFPIGSYVKLSSAVGAILIEGPNRPSNGQKCSILSQKVPKFELHKHNDELFNIYYGICF
jgi:hypothetical protein